MQDIKIILIVKKRTNDEQTVFLMAGKPRDLSKGLTKREQRELKPKPKFRPRKVPIVHPVILEYREKVARGEIVPKKDGQPPAELCESELIKLAESDCTTDEIAAHFGLSKSCIEDRFDSLVKEGRALGNRSLKNKIFELALAGNVPLLIWLSKVRFGWREEVQVAQTTYNVNVIEVPK